jgi:hypothetical protein
VLTGPVREVKAHFEAQGTRLNEKELLELADAPDPATRPARRFTQTPEQRAAAEFAIKKLQFYTEEGAALLVDPGRGDGGTLFVQSATVPQPADTPAGRRQTSWQKDPPKLVPQIVLAAEHYNRIMRMLQAGGRVRMSVNLDVQFHEQDLMGYNTVAEIPGSDPRLKDEIVMLGGHMDSWHGGTGATDNGAGKIRGVYTQGNAGVWPLFRQWLQPFRDMGAQTLTMSNTGGTDHLSFDRIGLPGFQFIQDEIEYDTRTHHSNQDVFDRIQADDMKQAATIMAAFVYQTAMRDDKLPRKPAPPR